MAKVDLRDSMAKRTLLHSRKTTDEERNEAADFFLREERYGEALEFLEITRDPVRLQAVKEAALDRADTFLLQRVEKIAGEPIPPETWRNVAARALSLGRFRDAWRALREAGDEERAEAVRTEHMPDFQPYEPEGK